MPHQPRDSTRNTVSLAVIVGGGLFWMSSAFLGPAQRAYAEARVEHASALRLASQQSKISLERAQWQASGDAAMRALETLEAGSATIADSVRYQAVLRSIAQDSGVRLDEIRTSSKSDAVWNISGSGEGAKVLSVSADMTLHGSFDSTTRFIETLSANFPLLRYESVQIQPIEATAAETTAPQVRCRLSVQNYALDAKRLLQQGVSP